MNNDFVKKRDTQDVIKKNISAFNKAIKNFNDRLKVANKSGKISKDTYTNLYIDKSKKEFFKANIYNKKQYNEFISDLKKANKSTLKEARKGLGVNLIPVTRYEYQMYRKNLKYVYKFDEQYKTDYGDIIFNAKKKDLPRIIRKLQTSKYLVINKEKRFMENFKKAYINVFNKDFPYKLTMRDISLIAKLDPNFKIELVYSDILNKKEREEKIKNAVEEYKKLKKEKGIKEVERMAEDAVKRRGDDFNDIE